VSTKYDLDAIREKIKHSYAHSAWFNCGCQGCNSDEYIYCYHSYYLYDGWDIEDELVDLYVQIMRSKRQPPIYEVLARHLYRTLAANWPSLEEPRELPAVVGISDSDELLVCDDFESPVKECVIELHAPRLRPSICQPKLIIVFNDHGIAFYKHDLRHPITNPPSLLLGVGGRYWGLIALYPWSDPNIWDGVTYTLARYGFSIDWVPEEVFA
jgi:hypothetical protein